MSEPKPFTKCNESCPLFGYHKTDGESYLCHIGNEPQFTVDYNAPCDRKMGLKEKRAYLKLQRGLERERDNLTTKIYHLQLLIDNCGSE